MVSLMDRLPIRSLATEPYARPAELPQLSPAQLEALVAAKLNEVCAGIAGWALPVVVVGVIGEIPDTRYSTIYKIPLTDPDDAGSTIYINAKQGLLQQAGVQRGDVVRIAGSITAELFRGQVSFRLAAVAIEHSAPAAVPQARVDNLTVETLRRLALARHQFPQKVRPTISLIHSAASNARVADDFLGALGDHVPQENVARIPCSMHDAEALAAAVRSVRSDVMVIVRGGGDLSEFAVFEDAVLLDALAACPSYRILGLGHSANRTLAELVADHAASTPTAAGQHVGQSITQATKLVRIEGLNREIRTALAEKELALERALRPAQTKAPFEQPSLPEAAANSAQMRLGRAPIWWMLLGAFVTWVLFRLL